MLLVVGDLVDDWIVAGVLIACLGGVLVVCLVCLVIMLVCLVVVVA